MNGLKYFPLGTLERMWLEEGLMIIADPKTAIKVGPGVEIIIKIYQN